MPAPARVAPAVTLCTSSRGRPPEWAGPCKVTPTAVLPGPHLSPLKCPCPPPPPLSQGDPPVQPGCPCRWRRGPGEAGTRALGAGRQPASQGPGWSPAAGDSGDRKERAGEAGGTRKSREGGREPSLPLRAAAVLRAGWAPPVTMRAATARGAGATGRQFNKKLTVFQNTWASGASVPKGCDSDSDSE